VTVFLAAPDSADDEPADDEPAGPGIIV